MKSPPAEHLRGFGDVPGKRRETYGSGGVLETVLYRPPKGKGMNAFTAYDKTREMEAHRAAMPAEHEGKNLMRLECRLMNKTGVDKLLGGGVAVRPYDIARPEMWARLEDLFLAFYNGIPKRDVRVNLPQGKITPSKFREWCANEFARGHPDEYEQMLQSAYGRGQIDRAGYNRIRKADRDKAKNAAITTPSGNMAELDEAIKNALRPASKPRRNPTPPKARRARPISFAATSRCAAPDRSAKARRMRRTGRLRPGRTPRRIAHCRRKNCVNSSSEPPPRNGATFLARNSTAHAANALHRGPLFAFWFFRCNAREHQARPHYVAFAQRL